MPQAIEEGRQVVPEASLVPFSDLFDVTGLDVLPPPGPGQVGGHAGDDEGTPAVPVRVGLLRLRKQENILRVEDAGVVPHGNPAHVEAGGASIADDQAVGVVVDGDLTPQLFQSVLELNEPGWDRAAEWGVAEDREPRR